MHMDWTDYLDTPLHAVFVNPMPAQGVRAPRKARKAKAPTQAKPARVREPTVAEMREFAKAMGLKVLSAHTKRELTLMINNNVNVRPAAYDKQAEKRKADRALLAQAKASQPPVEP